MRKVATLLSLLCVFGVSAQSNHPAKAHESKDVTVLLGNVEDSLAVYKAFVENAPKRYDIAGAPRFAIVGKNDKFYFGIGGTAKVTASFDFPNPISSGAFFTTSSIPMNTVPGNGGQLLINGQQTNLFLNFVALPGTANKLGFYFNFDLCGNSYAPHVQYAYLTYRGFLLGYNTSLYLDGAACAPTIDKEGPNSLTWEMNEVIDYTHTFDNGLTLAIGAEIGPKSFTNSDYTQTVSQRVPDIPAYIQYNFRNSQSYIRLSGLLRTLQYRDLVAEQNRNIMGWGVKMSGVVECSPKFLIYYQGAYGVGATSYFQDIAGMGLDLAPVTANNGELTAVKSWGAYIGLQYNWSKKCYSAVTYSHLRNYASEYADGTTAGASNPWDTQYRYGQYLAANVIYNITSNLSWGLEWDWGRRVDMDGLSHHDNRIQTMLQFNF